MFNISIFLPPFHTEKHVFCIAENTEKHVYSIRRIAQNTEKQSGDPFWTWSEKGPQSPKPWKNKVFLRAIWPGGPRNGQNEPPESS